MKRFAIVGLIAALGAISTQAAAQMQSSGQMSTSSMQHGKMMHHSMAMHGHMTRAQTMRWCHSMSHRKMMMNSRCRAMMHMHRAPIHHM